MEAALKGLLKAEEESREEFDSNSINKIERAMEATQAALADMAEWRKQNK